MKKKIKYVSTILMSFLLMHPVVAKTKYVDCGKIKHLPYKVIELSNTIISLLQIAVPVILVIMGSVDFVKAISSQNEDNVKKAQGMFIKRLIMGALVFFMFVIVKLIISIIGGNTDGIWKCVECFVNNSKSCK